MKLALICDAAPHISSSLLSLTILFNHNLCKVTITWVLKCCLFTLLSRCRLWKKRKNNIWEKVWYGLWLDFSYIFLGYLIKFNLTWVLKITYLIGLYLGIKNEVCRSKSIRDMTHYLVFETLHLDQLVIVTWIMKCAFTFGLYLGTKYGICWSKISEM